MTPSVTDWLKKIRLHKYTGSLSRYSLEEVGSSLTLSEFASSIQFVSVFFLQSQTAKWLLQCASLFVQLLCV